MSEYSLIFTKQLFLLIFPTINHLNQSRMESFVFVFIIVLAKQPVRVQASVHFIPSSIKEYVFATSFLLQLLDNISYSWIAENRSNQWEVFSKIAVSLKNTYEGVQVLKIFKLKAAYLIKSFLFTGIF